MNPSYPFDPELHRPGSVAAPGQWSWDGSGGGTGAGGDGGPGVSFQDREGSWPSGGLRALGRVRRRDGGVVPGPGGQLAVGVLAGPGGPRGSRGDRATGPGRMTGNDSAPEPDPMEIFDELPGGRLACRVCGAMVSPEGG